MSDFFKMDVFFVVSTVAVVILTIVGTVLALSLRRLVNRLDEIAEDAKAISGNIRESTGGIRSWLAPRNRRRVS